MRTIALAVALICCSLTTSQAQTLFSDDFESTLGQWTGKGNSSYYGVIVEDPLNPSNHALSFSHTNSAGDVFSPEIPVSPSDTYILSFDYLGFAGPGSPDGNFGGFIGIADEVTNPTATTVGFLAGTCLAEGNIEIDIIDDGAWHSYSIYFHPYQKISISDDAIHVTVEDWGGVGEACPAGIAGDAFFDNIRLDRVSPLAVEPTTWGKVKALYR